MDQHIVRRCVLNGRLNWNKHALERMMERGLTRAGVKHVLMFGEEIEDYPNDRPCPSALILGMVDLIPIHVVAAIDKDADLCHVITAYVPDDEHFEPDFRTRKR